MNRTIVKAKHRNSLTKKELEERIDYNGEDRPRLRSECWDFEKDEPKGYRPCPFVTCRYNNFIQEYTEDGTALLSFPGKEPDQMDPHTSCALDVQYRTQDHDSLGNGKDYKMPRGEVGAILDLTTERVRQIEETAQVKCLASEEGKELFENLVMLSEKGPKVSGFRFNGMDGRVSKKGSAE